MYKEIESYIKNRIISNKGESLIETLVALLITCMGLTLLPGAIISSARVNKKAESQFVIKSDAEQGEGSSVGQGLSEQSSDATVSISGTDISFNVDIINNGSMSGKSGKNGETAMSYYSYRLKTDEKENGGEVDTPDTNP